MTIATAYLTFIVAELPELHFSGGLAVVILGLFMSAYGKTVISPSTEHTMHHVWELLARNVENVVFLFAGMFIAMESLSSGGELGLEDYGYGVILYIMMHLIRALVILVHYPLLANIGYKINWKEAVILVVMAFKGAISLTLSLTVFHDEEMDSKIKAQIVLYTGIVVFLYVVIDSFLSKYIIHKLGLENTSQVADHMLISVANTIIQRSRHKQAKLAAMAEFRMADWRAVNQMTSPDNIMKSIVNEIRIGKSIV